MNGRDTDLTPGERLELHVLLAAQSMDVAAPTDGQVDAIIRVFIASMQAGMSAADQSRCADAAAPSDSSFILHPSSFCLPLPHDDVGLFLDNWRDLSQ